GLSRLEKAVDAAGEGPLDALVEGLAAVMLESRTLGVLVQREARHLDDADQRQIARRTDAVVAEIGALLRRDRRHLADADADLLVRAALAVLASPSYHAVAVPRPAGEAL